MKETLNTLIEAVNHPRKAIEVVNQDSKKYKFGFWGSLALYAVLGISVYNMTRGCSQKAHAMAPKEPAAVYQQQEATDPKLQDPLTLLDEYLSKAQPTAEKRLLVPSADLGPSILDDILSQPFAPENHVGRAPETALIGYVERNDAPTNPAVEPPKTVEAPAEPEQPIIYSSLVSAINAMKSKPYESVIQLQDCESMREAEYYLEFFPSRLEPMKSQISMVQEGNEVNILYNPACIDIDDARIVQKKLKKEFPRSKVRVHYSPEILEDIVHSVDPNIKKELMTSLLYVESAFDPDAVSGRGAVGLGQLMPSTALYALNNNGELKNLGISQKDFLKIVRKRGTKQGEISIYFALKKRGIDLKDPATSIIFASHYLSQMLEMNDGKLPLALAAYNAGPGNVERYNGIPPFRETRNYVSQVVRNGCDSIEHEIMHGDTLSKIASFYKVPVQDLISANPEIDPARIRIRQSVVVPLNADYSLVPKADS